MDFKTIYFVCKCLCLSVYVHTTSFPSEPVEARRVSDALELSYGSRELLCGREEPSLSPL